MRGSSEELEILAKKYQDNDLRPIDSLKKLDGLSLNILLYLNQQDEILSNRDDQLYIEQLQNNQPSGKITVIIGNEGGLMHST